MERQTKIIDASVFVKLFADERNSNKVHRLIEKFIEGAFEIITPEIIFLESLNALKYKKFDRVSLDKACKEMLNFQFTIINITEPILCKAIELSQSYNLSIYDAVYAAIACLHDAQLITEDKELLKVPNTLSLDMLYT